MGWQMRNPVDKPETMGSSASSAVCHDWFATAVAKEVIFFFSPTKTHLDPTVT